MTKQSPSLRQTFAMGALLAAALVTTVAAADWPDQVGLQLESLRSGMSKNLTGTLNQVHHYEFKYVELVLY